MKTFGLFMIIWLISILIIFNVLKEAENNQVILLLLSTNIAHIFHRLAKEELKQ